MDQMIKHRIGQPNSNLNFNFNYSNQLILKGLKSLMITILTATSPDALQTKAATFSRTHKKIDQIQYRIVGNSTNALFSLAIL